MTVGYFYELYSSRKIGIRISSNPNFWEIKNYLKKHKLQINFDYFYYYNLVKRNSFQKHKMLTVLLSSDLITFSNIVFFVKQNRIGYVFGYVKLIKNKFIIGRIKSIKTTFINRDYNNKRYLFHIDKLFIKCDGAVKLLILLSLYLIPNLIIKFNFKSKFEKLIQIFGFFHLSWCTYSCL